MFEDRRPLAFVFSTLASAGVAVTVFPSASNAYSVNTRGDIFLNQYSDIGRTLDPIRSANHVSNHDFQARLTLLSGPERHVKKNGTQTNWWKARFKFDVTNSAQNRSLTHLRINGRRYSFKTRKSPTGVRAGDTFRKKRFVLLRDYDPNAGTFSLANIKSGWWTNNPYGPNDYEKETVPEPFTILGTTMALGFGAFFRKKQKERQA